MPLELVLPHPIGCWSGWVPARARKVTRRPRCLAVVAQVPGRGAVLVDDATAKRVHTRRAVAQILRRAVAQILRRDPVKRPGTPRPRLG